MVRNFAVTPLEKASMFFMVTDRFIVSPGSICPSPFPVASSISLPTYRIRLVESVLVRADRAFILPVPMVESPISSVVPIICPMTLLADQEGF